MKIAVNRQAMLAVLGVCSHVVKSRSPRPILGSVRLVAGINSIDFTATDLDLALRWKLTGVTISRPGEIIVPADRLTAVIEAVEEEVVHIESIELNAVLSTPQGRFNLYGYNPTEYPPVHIYAPSASGLQISGGDLARMIDQTHFCIGKEGSPSAVGGLHFELGSERFTLAATDGYRASFVDRALASIPGSYTVPRRPIHLLRPLLTQSETLCRLQFTSNYATVAMYAKDAGEPTCILFTPLLHGTFPNCRSLMPLCACQTVVVDRRAFEAAIRQAGALASEDRKAVRLSIQADKVRVSSRWQEIGDAAVDLPGSLQGPPLELCFISTHLLDYLSHAKGETLTLIIGEDERKPVQFDCDPNSCFLMMRSSLV